MEELLVYAIYKKIDSTSDRKAMKGVFTAAVREHYLTYNGGYPENPVFTDKTGNTYNDGWYIPISGRKGRSVG